MFKKNINEHEQRSILIYRTSRFILMYFNNDLCDSVEILIAVNIDSDKISLNLLPKHFKLR